VYDERNYSENEQDMNESARYMKNAHTQQPCHQKNNKQDRKDTHESSIRFSSPYLPTEGYRLDIQVVWSKRLIHYLAYASQQ
jgi:hypothetical protein